jgi:hypothetical protein
MIKPDVLARILADPEFRTYETAKAVAMTMLAKTQRSALEELTIMQEERRNARLYVRSEENTSAGLPARHQSGAVVLEIEKRLMTLVRTRRHLPK